MGEGAFIWKSDVTHWGCQTLWLWFDRLLAYKSSRKSWTRRPLRKKLHCKVVLFLTDSVTHLTLSILPLHGGMTQATLCGTEKKGSILSKKSMFKRRARCGASVWEMRLQQAGTSAMWKRSADWSGRGRLQSPSQKQTLKEIMKRLWILIREGGAVNLNKHATHDQI